MPPMGDHPEVAQVVKVQISHAPKLTSIKAFVMKDELDRQISDFYSAVHRTHRGARPAP
jgi:hypothetical protein